MSIYVKYIHCLFRSLAIIGCLLGSLGLAAQDCSCPEKLRSPEQANLVFKGKVIHVNTNWISGGWKFTFQVEKSWKRQTGKVLIINTAWEKDCGYIFEEGADYLVHVYKGFTMKTSACMGNTRWKEEDVLPASMGEELTPQPSSNLPLMMGLMTLLGVLSIAFLTLILVRAKRKK